MATCMTDGGYQNEVVAQEECDVVWKTRQVDSPITTDMFTPEQRMLDDRATSALDLPPKSSP